MLLQRWSDVFVRTLIIVSVILLFSACAKQSARTDVVERPPDLKQEAVKQTMTEAKPSADKQIAESQPVLEKQTFVEKREDSAASLKKKPELLKQHIVKKGDSLWWIAKYKDQYNDPYLWPLIYKANKNMIKNPNIIYPGQKLKIPRTGFTIDEIKKERKKAGAPEPYLPPRSSNPPLN